MQTKQLSPGTSTAPTPQTIGHQVGHRQSSQVRLQAAGVDTITFYAPISNPARNTRNWLLFVSVIAAILSLIPVSVDWQTMWWIAGLIVAYALWRSPNVRDEIILDFPAKHYLTRRGREKSVLTSIGPFSDISCIRVIAAQSEDSVYYHTCIEFEGDKQKQICISDKRCDSNSMQSYSQKHHRYWIEWVCELAARLNVPLVDESGWRGNHPRETKAGRIVVLPGEIHPVLLTD